MRCIAFLLLMMAWMSHPAMAASSFDFKSDMMQARLITAEDGIAPGASTLSAGLDITLEDGWKTYWKSPGQVGYPPSVDWSASDNVASVDFQWPVPKRFQAFDIENYGYETAVTHPVKITLERPGEPVTLRAAVSLLVCSDVCVPQDFDLALSVYEGAAIDMSSAEVIARAAQKVPQLGDTSAIDITHAQITPKRDALSISLTAADPITDPNVFVDMGPETAFGPPSVSNGSDRTTITLPILQIPDETPTAEITIANGDQAAVFSRELITGSPTRVTQSGIFWTLLLAFVGGLILNVMPCVLPVLSIKFASALKSVDQPLPRIRAGFAVSALGVLCFMWALAVILIVVRATGGQVGWGIQFQSPVFLGLMVIVITLFAANLAGLFEITLPQRWTTAMARSETRAGYAGDFATGALAAVMATPCSAPFLGTAVTVALAGSNAETLAIFTALGAGLALPYALIALRPALIKRLPKPGAWMNTLRIVLAAMMAATGIWLLSVLATIVGPIGAGLVATAAVVGSVLLSFGKTPASKLAALAIPMLALVAAPQFSAAPTAVATDSVWIEFDESEIAARVDIGDVVLVDVTAAWCLTCKANKALVLDQSDIAARLRDPKLIAMRADWTKPDAAILAYLQENGRYGIPFNIVYGPGAPSGIALPEILTRDAVIDALNKAKG